MTRHDMTMDAFRSRAAKLKAMSLGELATRTSYAAFLAFERRRVASAVRPAKRRQARLDLDALRRPARFFAGLAQPARMRELFAPSGPYARQAEAARRAAADARQHHFEFFGQRFSYGSEIDWHADPVTRRPWPRVFHRDVPIHDGGDAIGDVKYVWELNRHQFLIDLGKAYWLFGDADAAAAVYRIVRHWIAENPYGIGVNWSCALEPAFRAWSWLWAYAFCHDDPALDDDTRARWLASFADHGRFLYRHLEHYASPYNHLIGEASALFALGVVFPAMPEATRWRQRGRRVLETQVREQFHADGGTVEQSAFYHHATLGFYLLAALLADADGDPLSGDVEAAVERGIAFSMSLQQPDGRVPSIGGADDGKCIRLEHLPFWDFRPFQAVGAVRYRRPDFRFAAGSFFEDALWLLGPDARDRFLQMPASPPPASIALAGSGYFVLRSEWGPKGDYLCFDCGEQAAGLRRDDVPSAAHGHADCLSVVLWLRGRPVLVDPGFFCYNGEPEWEVHFRRTKAHNTASVDGRDQSRHVHKMAWTRVFAPTLEAWRPTAEGGAVGGSHDGFLRECGIVHRRAAWLHGTGCALICDQFAGEGPHDIEIVWQCAPGAAHLTDDHTLLFDAAEIAWVATSPVEPSVRHGGAGPDGGWIAPSLGVKVPAPRVTLRLPFTPPVTTCFTLVVPREAGQSKRTAIESATPQRLAISVDEPGGERQVFELQVPSTPVEAGALVDALRVVRRQASGVGSSLAASGDRV